MIIKEYIKPSTIDEAYEAIKDDKKAVVVGGGAFLRLGTKKIKTAIDLSGLDLEFIKEDDNKIEIGAMTTLRDIENSQIIKNNFSGILSNACSEMMGVQIRNIATIGGTVYGKYGFSDFLTALAVLDAQVVLYNKGAVSIKEYLKDTKRVKDLVVKIVINKTIQKSCFLSLRNVHTDFAVLNVAVSSKEDKFKVVVGARPGMAKYAQKSGEYLEICELNEENIDKASEIASKELKFGSNLRGSEEYREEVCKTLVKRALMEVIQ